MAKNKLSVILILVVLIIAVLIPIIMSEDAADTEYTFNNIQYTISVDKSNGLGSYYDGQTEFMKKEHIEPLTRAVKEVNGNNDCELSYDDITTTGNNFYENNEFTNSNLPKNEFLKDGLGVTYYAHTIVLTKMGETENQIRLEYNHANVNKEFTPPKMYEYGLCFEGDGEEGDAVAYFIGCSGSEESWAVKCECAGAIYAKTQALINTYKQKVKEKFVNCDDITWTEKSPNS